MFVRFGRDTCCNLDIAERREWLVTNGLGGYACGTVAGLLARRYHGLLIAARQPPVGRVLLVPKIDETATYCGRTFSFATNRWADGTIAPRGFINIESFHLDGTAPVWRFACAEAIVEKRLWMPHGANATCVRYWVERASQPVHLEFAAFVDVRDHHGSSRAAENAIRVAAIPGGITFSATPVGPVGFVTCEDATWQVENTWYHGFDLARERERGLDDRDDHLCAARAFVSLNEGEACTIELRAAGETDRARRYDWSAFSRRESDLVERSRASRSASRANGSSDVPPAWIDQLVLAADQFVVQRAEDTTIIAGYPWFTDFGRDALMSLPGLALATGRADVAKKVLLFFASRADEGMVPNYFPDDGAPPMYNTVDATLWFFVALREYLETTGDTALVSRLFSTLQEMVASHVRGTRFGIRRDEADGLLYAGEPGVALTWMDAIVGDRVVTPRIGKPVEVNALWCNALRAMARFAEASGQPRSEYENLAARADASFDRFWNERTGFCFDVIDGPNGDDPAFRPNQILAVSLPERVLATDRARAVVDACASELLASFGLRSLAPSEPAYHGAYEGDPATRDGAYHQGTVWAWLLGPFALAHHRVYGNAERALRYLAPIEDLIGAYGVGSIGEIFDGDPPFSPRGCFAQAWSVAETLRCWVKLTSQR